MEATMSGRKLQWLIALVLLIHAIGHTMGILPAAGYSLSSTWTSHSWLLSGAFGQTAANVLSVAIWLAATVGFLLAALALMGWGVPHAWWRPLAIVSAVVSLLGLFLFWNAFASWFNKAGAILVNVAILFGLLVRRWPKEADLARPTREQGLQ
jgi:MFS family permease